MLVGDVPWEMFADSCRRLRIMKGSDAIGLGKHAVLFCLAYYRANHIILVGWVDMVGWSMI